MSSWEKRKSPSIEEIRQKYPKAYELWTRDEDALLLQMYACDKDIDKLSDIFQRGPRAIKSRLRKLKNLEVCVYSQEHDNLSDFNRTDKIVIGFYYDWIPVLRNEDEIYLFPNALTSFMSRLYKAPAIYRWNIYRETPADARIIYIGEGQRLVPDRIKGYLKPGPSQMTNKRLNARFREFIQNGYKVLLEILRFDEMYLGDSAFKQSDLKNKHFRRFLEHMLITYYQQKGYTMLNR